MEKQAVIAGRLLWSKERMPDLSCNLAGRRSEQLWQKKTAWSTEDRLEKQEPVKGAWYGCTAKRELYFVCVMYVRAEGRGDPGG